MTAQHSTAGNAQAAIWDRELPLDRDRTSRLTVEQVTSAAIGLARAEGLGAVSLKRVANRLRIPPPRLAQYLHDLEDLHDLMLDAGLADLVGTDAATGWRDQLEGIAVRTRTAGVDDPWLVELITARPSTGPHGLRFVEQGLAALGAAGLDVRTSALCFHALLAFVRGSVPDEVAHRGPRRGAAAGSAEYLAATVSDHTYPYLNALFADPSGVTRDESFEVGLQCVLDGFAARIATAQ